MSVNAARHERSIAEVNVGALRVLVDADDQTLVDDHCRVGVLMTSSIEHTAAWMTSDWAVAGRAAARRTHLGHFSHWV